MTDSPSSSSPRDAAAWQCFRYIAGELTPDEVVDFEQALADDQSLREALATEVELVQAVAAAEATRMIGLGSVREAVSGSGDGKRAWTGRVRWMAVGAALSLSLVLLWQADRWLPAVARQADPVAAVPAIADPAPLDAASPQLALAWSAARDELASDDLLHWSESHLPESDSPDHGVEEPAARSSVSQALTHARAAALLADDSHEAAELLNESPSWMLAAVASMQGGKPAGDEPTAIPYETPGDDQP